MGWYLGGPDIDIPLLPVHTRVCDLTLAKIHQRFGTPCFVLTHEMIQLLSIISLSLIVQKEKGYTTLQDEAVRIFNSLQEIETVPDPVPIIQGILQTCQDLKPLRDEVYCQLIKQTNHVTQPNSPAILRHWQLLACTSCTFLPGREILRYLKFHLKR